MAQMKNSIVLLALAIVFTMHVALFQRYYQQDQLLAAAANPRIIDTTIPLQPSEDWKPVYVYRGGPQHHLEQVWNGQVEQDKLISWLTKNKTNGYFVDLAANGAEILSNTISLERHFNWNGLCIEANPSYWHELGRLRSCTVVGAVIGKHANDKILFSMRGTGGGIAGDTFDNKVDDKTAITEERFTAQLDKTFEQFHVPKVIDYLSLDVEGAEDYIMGAFPFESYRFRFLTVERPSPELTKKLAEHGYRYIKKLVFFGDTLFAHESELPIDEAIIDRYCKESGGKYCGEEPNMAGFRFSAMTKTLQNGGG